MEVILHHLMLFSQLVRKKVHLIPISKTYFNCPVPKLWAILNTDRKKEKREHLADPGELRKREKERIGARKERGEGRGV